MNILDHRTGLFALIAIIVGGPVYSQPTAPTPERVAELKVLIEGARPIAADEGDGKLPTGGFGEIDTTGREVVRTLYRTVFNASEDVPMEWTGDYNTGDSGDTSQNFKDAVLRRINFFRAMSGLDSTVTFSTTFSAKAQDAALMMSANNALNHFPPNTWTFWTADGAEAAKSSNLAIGSFGPDSVLGYMQDHGASNAAVGHRRWFLYPQTEVMGTGDVPGIPNVSNRRPANDIWVFDDNFGGPRPGTRENFVAWPPKGHVPYRLIYPRWSLAAAGANFGSATVSMTRRIGNGSPESVTVVKEPFSGGTGEPTLVWVYDGLDATVSQNHDRPDEDVTYTVTVSGVSGASQSTYTYEVIVFDPETAGSDYEAPVTAGPPNPSVGQDNAYTVDVGPLTNLFQWRSFQTGATGTVSENAENGAGNVEISQSGSYTVMPGGAGVGGSTAFNLRHDAGNQDETVTLKGTFLATATSQLSFSSRVSVASADQSALAQVSFDDGSTWITVWDSGHQSTLQEGSYSQKNIPLASYSGQTLNVRFLFSIGFGSWFTGSAVGWYFDDIVLKDVQAVSNVTGSETLTGDSYSFNPGSVGAYGLQVRGVFHECYPLDWGPVTSVAAAEGSNEAPTITTQPAGGTVDEGGSISLTVVATGSPAPTYQWKKGGVALSGATSATLNLTDVTADEAGSYTVTVSNNQGSVTSSAAVVTVSAGMAPTITTQPVGGTVDLGGSISLTVVATGDPPPTYQWKKGGQVIDGAIASMLTLNSVGEDDGGDYTVQVTNSAGSISSEVATVSVNTPPAITGQPGGASLESGDSYQMGVRVSGQAPFAYQWFKDGAMIQNANSAFHMLTDIGVSDAGSYTVEVTNATDTVASTAAVIVVNSSTFSGAYFGKVDTDQGDFALWVRGSNQAILVVFLPGSSVGIFMDPLTIEPDGSFSVDVGGDVGTVSGEITGDSIAGSISGIGKDFDGTRSDPDGSAGEVAGSYRVVVVNESSDAALFIVGGDGRAMFYLPDENEADAAVGTVDGSGKFSGITSGGFTVTLDLDADTSSVSGTFAGPGNNAGFLGAFREGVPAPHLLANISMRGNVGTGSGIMIAGFVVEGAGGKPILVRAVGPTLDGFGVQGTIADPQLTVSVLAGADIGGNDNWEDASNVNDVVATAVRVGAFALGSGEKDSAALVTMVDGRYTARVSGVNDAIGVSLVEVYDADEFSGGVVGTRLINISMRGNVGTGNQIMIAGFVIEAGFNGSLEVPKLVLIRGIGPRLSDFGVQGAIDDPSLILFKGNAQIALNDNWEEAADVNTLVEKSALVGAFDLISGSKDAALLIWLVPGSYTAQVSGVGDTTGLALVEVYAVP